MKNNDYLFECDKGHEWIGGFEASRNENDCRDCCPLCGDARSYPVAGKCIGPGEPISMEVGNAYLESLLEVKH